MTVLPVAPRHLDSDLRLQRNVVFGFIRGRTGGCGRAANGSQSLLVYLRAYARRTDDQLKNARQWGHGFPKSEIAIGS